MAGCEASEKGAKSRRAPPGGLAARPTGIEAARYEKGGRIEGLKDGSKNS
jgi:hypothetical protein